MALRLSISDRAVLEIGEAYDWYEEQRPGLGSEFLAALDSQFGVIAQTPGLYEEVRRGVLRALLAHFPYGVFYATRIDVVSILGVIHTSRHPWRWPRR